MTLTQVIVPVSAGQVSEIAAIMDSASTGRISFPEGCDAGGGVFSYPLGEDVELLVFPEDDYANLYVQRDTDSFYPVLSLDFDRDVLVVAYDVEEVSA